jgi:hypothetical protein
MPDYLKEAPVDVILDAITAAVLRRRPDDIGLSDERIREVRRYLRSLLSACRKGDGQTVPLPIEDK